MMTTSSVESAGRQESCQNKWRIKTDNRLIDGGKQQTAVWSQHS